MHLDLALGYGGCEEIVAVVRDILLHEAHGCATLVFVAASIDATSIVQSVRTFAQAIRGVRTRERQFGR